MIFIAFVLSVSVFNCAFHLPLVVYTVTYRRHLSAHYRPQYPHFPPSPISCTGMKLFDITKDGADEIIVGRDDGRLDVYSQDAGMERKTMQSFSKDIGTVMTSCPVRICMVADPVRNIL
jgi:hypothetical protein